MDDHVIYDEPIFSPEGTEDECTPEEEANVRTQEEESGDPELTVENNNVSTMEFGFQVVEKKRSLVWPEFLTLDRTKSSDGKQRSICKHFQKAFFITNPHYGTQNMQRHLRERSAYEKYMKNQGGNGLNKGKIFNQIVYRNLVAKAIIKHGYAFSCVEHDGNREIHAYLSDDVKFICRNTAKVGCLKMHTTLKAQLKETLSKVFSRISLACDMWTSCQTERYLCLTAHYVDDNWKLISTMLNFSHIDSPHTGKTMYAAMLSMLQDWVLKFCYENIFGDVEATLRVSDLHLKLEKFYKLYAQTGTSSTLNNNTDMAHASHSRASISSTSTGNRKRKFDHFVVIVLLLF
uniref:Uncharacterized protein n=1 Tax=Chenopodium quinoa TaxID=63459 RepID=A0A803N767_CHEQI